MRRRFVKLIYDRLGPAVQGDGQPPVYAGLDALRQTHNWSYGGVPNCCISKLSELEVSIMGDIHVGLHQKSSSPHHVITRSRVSGWSTGTNVG